MGAKKEEQGEEVEPTEETQTQKAPLEENTTSEVTKDNDKRKSGKITPIRLGKK
jgi:hypothetical protein